MKFNRFGIYYTPPVGDFAAAGAQWLGWDIAAGRAFPAPHPTVVETPRKYGFHATMKPPFRLADGFSQAELETALAAFCERQAPCPPNGLSLSRLGSFFALVLTGDTSAIDALAGRAVRDLDHFRAPLSDAERARKTRPNMRPDLVHNLNRWGYPHVMAAFRFHMTLTGPVETSRRQDIVAQASAHFDAVLPRPFILDNLSLVGESDSGMLHEIRRFALGSTACA